MSKSDAQGIQTRAVRGGLSPDPVTGAILTPIYQSTTYVLDGIGRHKGYTYSRAANPTVDALERALGALEVAPPAVCFGTGMAAVVALFFSLLRTGDHAIVSDVVYGGVVRFARILLDGLGVACSFIDTSRAKDVEHALTRRTRLILVETPANPTLKLTDIEAVARVARAAHITFAVDNTFLTPVLQRPLDLGADVTLLSTTKYVEGHNATVGGSIASRDAALLERLRLVRKTLGSIQSPQEAWLTLRGLKTLPLRMQQHSASALAIAAWLERHPAVERVAFPGLASFPQRDLGARQQAAPGGMISFELRGGARAGTALMNSVKLCALAESLGAAETLITHPATMTHPDVPQHERQAVGISDGLIRLSVGLEDPDDIIADLAQALERSVLCPA